MKKLKLIITIIFFMFCSCESKKDQIFNNIDKQCKIDTFIINMSNVTPFDWDKMYVFSPSVHMEELDKYLGFHYPYFDDIANRLIFTKSNKIVYHEDNFPYPDKLDKLFFYFYDNTQAMVFNKQDANFLAVRNIYNDIVLFELLPLKGGFADSVIGNVPRQDLSK